MNASYPIRPIAMSELPQFMRVADHAFNSSWPTDEVMAWDKLVFEEDRSLAAFDGAEIVGTTTIISFDLTVPGGGQVGTAGVTSVAVLPSHRRQGVLSALMKRQLANVAARKEPLAALFASESVIYGRYGYGVASRHQHYTIKRGEALLPQPGKRPRLRICEPKDVVASLKVVYDAAQVTRPGMLTRSQGLLGRRAARPGIQSGWLRAFALPPGGGRDRPAGVRTLRGQAEVVWLAARR